jgi:hypothetical protein
MATKTESRRKEQRSARAERAADRPGKARPTPKSQDVAPAGRDEKSIGATRLPRKGDDTETD